MSVIGKKNFETVVMENKFEEVCALVEARQLVNVLEVAKSI